MELVNIHWEGPFSLSEIETSNNPILKKKGVYQFYGQHYVYGSDVLLYIGKTTDTFKKRALEHWHPDRRIMENLPKFYFGVLKADFKADFHVENFNDLLRRVEKLLIYVHAPAYNSQFISGDSINLQNVSDLIIYNWGQHHSLLTELSGARWHEEIRSVRLEEGSGQ